MTIVDTPPAASEAAVAAADIVIAVLVVIDRLEVRGEARFDGDSGEPSRA